MRLGIAFSAKILLMTMSSLVWAGETADSLLREARESVKQGDLIYAARTYKEVLILEPDNHEARRGLASVIIAGQMNEPHAEEAEPLATMLEENSST